jgi:hypothetical protein
MNRSSSRSAAEVSPGLHFDDDVPIYVTDSLGGEPAVTQIHVKVTSSDQVRAELSNELNLFFLYETAYTADDVAGLARSQKLTISLADFPGLLVEIFSGAKDPQNPFELLFVAGTEPLLHVQQRFRFKVVDVFALRFAPASDEDVRARIQERFDGLRAEVAQAKEDLASVSAMLKIKNPSSLRQLRPK